MWTSQKKACIHLGLTGAMCLGLCRDIYLVGIMLNRLRDAIEAGRSAVVDAEAEKAAEEQPVDALLVLDELGPLADETRKRHIDAASAAGHRPLLILGPDSELEHNDLAQLCEFLPRAEDIVLATGYRPDAIRQYRLARLRLIFEKWRITECRWIGDSALEVVEFWTESDNPVERKVTFLPAL